MSFVLDSEFPEESIWNLLFSILHMNICTMNSSNFPSFSPFLLQWHSTNIHHHEHDNGQKVELRLCDLIKQKVLPANFYPLLSQMWILLWRGGGREHTTTVLTWMDGYGWLGAIIGVLHLANNNTTIYIRDLRYYRLRTHLPHEFHLRPPRSYFYYYYTKATIAPVHIHINGWW